MVSRKRVERTDPKMPMKALTCSVILSGCSTRVDGSISIRLSTPELSGTEKAAIFDLQGKELKILLQPVDNAPDELVAVKRDLDFKTPGQRLRNTIFVWWKQLEDGGKMGGKSFDLFYGETMNRIIEDVKRNLEPEPS